MIEKLIYEVIGILTIISAIMVISVKNPIHSILYLILVYINVTALLIMWEIEFIAMILLIVYIGAVAILFLFVVMMLNIKLVELTENQIRYLPIGGIIGVIFLFELLILLEKERVKLVDKVEEVNYIHWENIIKEISNIKVLGEVLYTEYSYFFLLAGIILLIGMIGAITLTERSK